MGRKDFPPGFTCAPSPQTNPLPIILCILLISPYINKDQSSIVLEDGETDDYIYDSDIIFDMLTSIYPYLDSEYQAGINLILGLVEARTILKSLLKGTYYKFSQTDTNIQPASHQEKVIGLIRSLQPYISLKNQVLINRILDTFNNVKELNYRLTRLKQQSLEVQDSRKHHMHKVMELIDIIKILVPIEQQQYINQISKSLRMLETVELAQLLNTSEKDTSSTTINNKVTSNTDVENYGENIEGSTSTNDLDIESDKKTVDLEALSHSLKTMLKPEQAKSLDLIMKMAQLFTQDNTENESAD